MSGICFKIGEANSYMENCLSEADSDKLSDKHVGPLCCFSLLCIFEIFHNNQVLFKSDCKLIKLKSSMGFWNLIHFSFSFVNDNILFSK